MMTLTAIVAYMLACIVALAYGARWVLKNDPLLRKHVLKPNTLPHAGPPHPHPHARTHTEDRG
ncbi:hypothetical protein [Cupriavidus plantarum]|uniref:hypothetical protein n=1 Tax=Cupriavidus plantarum TaxID=942865 RepID=UPI000E26B74A|nr:hypothetical protein [Cupriavidus plantarum]NYH98847.1 hypothetical protein [Cupriavidus plantarum]REF01772.1 hypothetical protein C7418_0557 [Cupriavidus plantarum]CAG2128280.1 hypothetical protein LMG26296_01329 [Cupriavidus plantarum]SMR66539.1 hypothetical protein SAMN05421735_1423 [Cupriavidus plantarum]